MATIMPLAAALMRRSPPMVMVPPPSRRASVTVATSFQETTPEMSMPPALLAPCWVVFVLLAFCWVPPVLVPAGFTWPPSASPAMAMA